MLRRRPPAAKCGHGKRSKKSQVLSRGAPFKVWRAPTYFSTRAVWKRSTQQSALSIQPLDFIERDSGTALRESGSRFCRLLHVGGQSMSFLRHGEICPCDGG